MWQTLRLSPKNDTDFTGTARELIQSTARLRLLKKSCKPRRR